MIANTVTLTDGTTPISYDLVSREGMNSKRVQTVVASDVAGNLTIKNTVGSSPATKNRHLMQLQAVEVDGTTGDVHEGSVHIVISRDKKYSDAGLLLLLEYIADLAITTASMQDVLKGGN